MAAHHKFFEVIHPGTNIDFIGTRRYWIAISVVLVLLSVVFLPLNAYVLKGRGQMLNWSVEFKGGSEIETHFSKPVEPAQIREALETSGYHGVEAYRSFSATGGQNDYMIRMGAVATLGPAKAKIAFDTLKTKPIGGARLHGFELSEGGDKLYLRFDKAVEIPAITEALKQVSIVPTQVQTFGRAEDHSYEATLVSLETDVRKALESKFGAGTVSIKQATSVGAKAGAQLVNDGVKALLGAILLIVIYVAFRFDFRYGPGTIAALLHDAVLTVGAFAITYKEFSLTTLAALLTIIGFSMNDTIVVFDRIRENAGKHRDRRFDRVVNQSINETLSRTILTSATVFFVTLAMNIFGTGVIRDFAFAMNVGVIVGTYSSIFIASPMLIWLNDRFLARGGKQGQKSDRPQARRPIRRQDDDGNSAEV